MVAVPSDEISEKYLQKAISETNELGEEIARDSRAAPLRDEKAGATGPR